MSSAYAPFGFTHQRGVLQAGPLFDNAEVPYPGRETIARELAPAVAWAKAHPDRILWNGEFGTIRHIPAPARVAFMRDTIAICRAAGIPYCVWNYLSTPNDGNRFSLVDDDTRDFLSPVLLDACLGRGDYAAEGRLTVMSFNLCAPSRDNPVCARDLKEANIILRNEPDLVACQEATPEFWASRLFPRLATEYGVVRGGDASKANLNPILYRRARLELIEGGFAWGVFSDRATGRRFIACSAHELPASVSSLKARHGELPILVLGDLNATNSLDRVISPADAINPVSFKVDRSQAARECTDHAPALLTFRFR